MERTLEYARQYLPKGRYLLNGHYYIFNPTKATVTISDNTRKVAEAKYKTTQKDNNIILRIIHPDFGGDYVFIQGFVPENLVKESIISL